MGGIAEQMGRNTAGYPLPAVCGIRPAWRREDDERYDEKGIEMERRPESTWKRIWRLIGPMVIYQGIGLLVGLVFAVKIMSGMLPELGTEVTSGQMEALMTELMSEYLSYYLEIQMISVVLSLPVILFVFYRDRKRRLAGGWVEERPDRAPAWMFLTLLFGAITAYAANGMIALSGLSEVTDSYDQVAESFYQGRLLLEFACLGVLTPIMEELIFRGLMYNQLVEMTRNKKVAVIMSALIFSSFHMNFLQMIYAFALGLLMIYVYERFHTLLAPVLFHIGANMLGVLISETEALSFLYSTRGAMYVSVICFSLMIIGVVWLIERREGCLQETAPEDSDK